MRTTIDKLIADIIGARRSVIDAATLLLSEPKLPTYRAQWPAALGNAWSTEHAARVKFYEAVSTLDRYGNDALRPSHLAPLYAASSDWRFALADLDTAIAREAGIQVHYACPTTGHWTALLDASDDLDRKLQNLEYRLESDEKERTNGIRQLPVIDADGQRTGETALVRPLDPSNYATAHDEDLSDEDDEADDTSWGFDNSGIAGDPVSYTEAEDNPVASAARAASLRLGIPTLDVAAHTRRTQEAWTRVAELEGRVAYLEGIVRLAALLTDGDPFGAAVYKLAVRATGEFDLDDPTILSLAR